MFNLSLVFVIAQIIVSVSAISPYVVEWNTTHSYGPDGPWPVVTVAVGTDKAGNTASWVDLHPGGIWESMLPTTAFCSNSASPNPCLAQNAGLYNLNASTHAFQNVSSAPGLVWQWGSDKAWNMTGFANDVLDGMSITGAEGPAIASNSTITAVDRSRISLPDGTSYSTEVGTLSLGSPGDGYRTLSSGKLGTTFPGELSYYNITASNSFGLHYGSVANNQTGSLVFGGFDQSRIVGDVGAYDLGSDNGMLASLLDVQIGVENGSSPFSADSFQGLLKLNSAFNGIQPTIVNPVVPYFFMSPATCSAIAQNLPVTLQPNIGLYTWNTADPQYQKIITSSAYLAFVFQDPKGNLTIKVPFQLLNLTLDAPIVSTPQQYFPCRPSNTADNRYYFGKAFLQAAYIGINWENKKWFLGQAPGPGAGASNVQNIEPTDAIIGSDPIANFASTWSNKWTVLSAANKSSSAPDTSTSTSPSSGTNSSSGLSTGAKAGIGVGVAIGVLGLCAAAAFFLLSKRRHNARRNEGPETNISNPVMGYREFHEKDAGSQFDNETTPRYESGEGLAHEVEANNEVHEM